MRIVTRDIGHGDTKTTIETIEADTIGSIVLIRPLPLDHHPLGDQDGHLLHADLRDHHRHTHPGGHRLHTDLGGRLLHIAGEGHTHQESGIEIDHVLLTDAMETTTRLSENDKVGMPLASTKIKIQGNRKSLGGPRLHQKTIEPRDWRKCSRLRLSSTKIANAGSQR